MGKLLLTCGLLAWAIQAQAATVTITTNPTTLTFTYQSGSSTLPKAQTVTMKASSGNPGYTAAIGAIAPAGSHWLTLSAVSGNLPASLVVSVNPTSLPVGQFAATITLTVGGIDTAVTVNLMVTEAPSTLTLSQTSFNLTSPPDPPAQTVTLSTNGAPIAFTATPGAAWMSASPTVGVVLPGDPVVLTITASGSGLTPQTAPYTGKITVVASGAAVTVASQNITVNLTVNSVTPTITAIWPSSLPVGGGNQTITIIGTNFYSSTVAKIQGLSTALSTTVKSGTEMFAVVPSSLLTSASTLQVYADNPAPGGPSANVALPVSGAPSVAGVFNAASYFSDSISPGELATIFGTNIGPTAPAAMSVTAGYVDTTLGGVGVTIDGKAAPILYASDTQVTVQVPYEVSIGTLKNVVLTNGANPPATAQVTITATAPGIFTADGSGGGQAAALNDSSTGTITLNGKSNLATIGETVTLYLTGEGDYNSTPLSGTTNTGYIIPASINPLPTMATTPTVSIGGVDATSGVTYAGVVPGSIIGILQINVAVPAGSATGTAIPVTVTIGGNTTQANVTLGIHK